MLLSHTFRLFMPPMQGPKDRNNTYTTNTGFNDGTVRRKELRHEDPGSPNEASQISLSLASSYSEISHDTSSPLLMLDQELMATIMASSHQKKRSSWQRDSGGQYELNKQALDFKGNHVTLSQCLKAFRTDDSLLPMQAKYNVCINGENISLLRTVFGEGDSIHDLIIKAITKYSSLHHSDKLNQDALAYEAFNDEGDGQPDLDCPPLQFNQLLSNLRFCDSQFSYVLVEKTCKSYQSQSRAKQYESVSVIIAINQEIQVPLTDDLKTFRNLLSYLHKNGIIKVLIFEYLILISEEDCRLFKYTSPIMNIEDNLRSVGASSFILARRLHVYEEVFDLQHAQNNRPKSQRFTFNDIGVLTHEHSSGAKDENFKQMINHNNNNDTKTITSLASEVSKTAKDSATLKATTPVYVVRQWFVKKKSKFFMNQSRCLKITSDIIEISKVSKVGQSLSTSASKQRYFNQVRSITKLTDKQFMISWSISNEVYDQEFVCSNGADCNQIINTIRNLMK